MTTALQARWRTVTANWLVARVVAIGVLAALAYPPALLSSPGRMPADTKLYLYLDPGGLLGRAASTFEPDQFAGWVPHQQITYLWPSGPWFWLAEAAGLGDWVAHRLWIGTILFAAGTGVGWTARQLGLRPSASLVAAIVYQCSPFLLAYVSRTSLLLLPWAALGWIVGLTIRATRQSTASTRLERWRDPALIALIVATVGSGNATALVLIVPAPLLWLFHAARLGEASRRHVFAVAAATGGLCAAVSMWWVSMLLVQSRFGADVLSYSETLTDVSRNATGSELLRGLGYWLFYVRDPLAPTTTASLDYLISSRVIVVSYLVVLVGLFALVTTRWAHRRFAALLVATGMVLSVGVHPIDNSSPLMRLVTGDGDSGLALALRSSTRATPVLLLGVALGAGALVTALPGRITRRHLPARGVVAALVGTIAVLNLPVLWSASLVDPAIDRDSDPPAAWLEAAATVDQRGGDHRTMQLPGAEFGAFRWGYTVDQPLVALTDRPVVTRDLLPLGSAAAMDLLYAYDDRWQAGTQELASVAPIARLFGADTLWLTNDSAFERFQGPRPEVVDAQIDEIRPDGGVASVRRFGQPVVNRPEVAMIDPTSLGEPVIGQPIAPVAVAEIADPASIVRAKTDVVVLSGSGDGVVDAAAAGLISGHEVIRYSASLDAATIADATRDRGDGRGADARVIVTDSNRDRAHHWRGSQDVVGHTEPGGPADDVLTPTRADRRLDVFGGGAGDVDAGRQTVAVQDGLVTAVASSYGEPFAYRPEDRAVMAIDGDAATAWRVADHGDPVGERIELTVGSIAAPRTAVMLRQADARPGGRVISTVNVSVDGGDRVAFDLDDRSLSGGGQRIDVEPMVSGSTLSIEIAAVTDGDTTRAASRDGVGFAEIDLGLGPTRELIRPPTDALEAVVDAPLDIVLTRLRVAADDPWRSDPEPALHRLLPLASPTTFDGAVTLRLDRNATDDELSAVLDSGAVVASDRLRGSLRHRGAAAADGDLATSWVSSFDGAVGSTIEMPAGALGTSMAIWQPPAGPYSTVSELTVRRGATTAVLAVPTPDADGRSEVSVPTAVRSADAPVVSVTVSRIEARTTVDRRYGDVLTLPVAISEIDLGDATSGLGDGPGLAAECDPGYLSIDGVGVPISFRASAADLVDGTIQARFCDRVELAAGEHRLRSHQSALHVDRVVLSAVDRADRTVFEPPTVTLERNDDQRRRVRLSACVEGCWLVHGEGFNPAWSASIGSADLGAPELVDGGFNGWWIAPTDLPTVIDIEWTAQRPVMWAIWWSVGAVLLALVLVVGALISQRDLARHPLSDPHGIATFETLRAANSPLDRGPAVRSALLFVVACGLLIAPVWAAFAAPVAGVWLLAQRWQVRVAEVAGFGAAVVVAISVVWIERRDAPIPNAGWTVSFEHLHGLAVFAVLAIAAGSALERDR